MRRLVVLATILVASCAREATSPPASQPTEVQRRLRSILESAPGDPVGDARRAAARRDFRLFWHDGHWGGSALIGLHCRIPPEASYDGLRLLTTLSGTGSPHCGSLGETDLCALEDRLRSYMPAYNRALLASPAFPYPDLCVSEDMTNSVHPAMHDPHRFPAERPSITDNPRNIGEAARLGSRASLEQLLLSATAAELNRADDFGLTPLAWAVVERRREAAALLRARGADPIACYPGQRAALVIALRSGQNALADDMLTDDIRRRLNAWPNVILEAAEQGGHRRLVREIERARERTARAQAAAERERQRTAEQAQREALDYESAADRVLRGN